MCARIPPTTRDLLAERMGDPSSFWSNLPRHLLHVQAAMASYPALFNGDARSSHLVGCIHGQYDNHVCMCSCIDGSTGLIDTLCDRHTDMNYIQHARQKTKEAAYIERNPMNPENNHTPYTVSDCPVCGLVGLSDHRSQSPEIDGQIDIQTGARLDNSYTLSGGK